MKFTEKHTEQSRIGLLGQLMRARMEEKGLGAAEVARRINIAPSQVNRALNGNYKMDIMPPKLLALLVDTPELKAQFRELFPNHSYASDGSSGLNKFNESRQC